MKRRQDHYVVEIARQTKTIIQNGQIMADKVINYTEADKRRTELLLGIGYNDDIDQAHDAHIFDHEAGLFRAALCLNVAGARRTEPRCLFSMN